MERLGWGIGPEEQTGKQRRAVRTNLVKPNPDRANRTSMAKHDGREGSDRRDGRGWRARSATKRLESVSDGITGRGGMEGRLADRRQTEKRSRREEQRRKQTQKRVD